MSKFKLTADAKSLKIIEIVRDEKFVRFKYQTSDLASEKHSVEFVEAPTPAFDEQLQSLARVAAGILEYGSQEDLTVTSLTISRTSKGTKSATIEFYKPLQAVDAPHLMKTPQFRIDLPADGEQGVRQCIEGEAQSIYKMLEEAQKYLAGDRQQMILPLVADDEDDDSEQEAGAVLFKPDSTPGKKTGRTHSPTPEAAS